MIEQPSYYPSHLHAEVQQRVSTRFLAKLAATFALLVCLSAVASSPASAQPSQQDRDDAAGTPPGSGAVTPSPPASGSQGVGVAPGQQPARQEVQGIAWLKQQPSDHYTLQLMAAVSPAPLYTLAGRVAQTEPVAVVASRRNGKQLHLLLQGSYATRHDAEHAAQQIGQQYGERPWIRRFSSLPELFESGLPSKPEKRPLPAVQGAAWLWSRNPSHYTIQLMGDRRADRLRTFVAEQLPAEPLAIVRVVRKGEPWYLLLAGDYGSQQEALAAIAGLPERMSGRGPWPRRFAALQDQLVSGNH